MTDRVDPVEVIFGGLTKLGPGSDEETLRALRALPRRRFGRVVDAGCGAGRQTLVLARDLGTVVDAVDTHQPFLDDLTVHAGAAGVGHLVRARRLDMRDIPNTFGRVDLLWSESAAYSIGFANALRTWAPAITADGFVVVSELSWLTGDPPGPAADFFATVYPDMATVEANQAHARDAGYEVLTTFTLAPASWTEGYYDLLGPRARALQDHPDEQVRRFAAGVVREIEVFETCSDSYGYVFYLLRRA